ncbi:thioredoxin domain-containing protein 3-like [Cimex lectularius]|uniref:Uncharacterized protein n=1 Tax=Cimex lectularius TaxID=79782 RepID=A0A8I6RR33_CIMLE|nr:thioredoxin domain-containing protein 3-like [Cimex lectularius]
MAKKSGQTSLQVEVQSDEEWNALLARPGLIVIDVFSEWCGPCLAMMSNLKKLKLESGVEQFHLALANADTIRVLSRFKGRSEPTWMIAAGGQLMRILFGSNAPMLTKTVLRELDKEVKCMAGLSERKGMTFEEVTPDEQQKLDEIEAKKSREAELERKELAAQLDKVKLRNYERLGRVMNTQTIVVFFPPSIVEPEEPNGKRTCAASYKLMAKYDNIGLSIADQLDILLSREEIMNMMYNSGLSLPEELLKMTDTRACIAALIQDSAALAVERGQPGNAINLPLDQVEQRLAAMIYGEKMDPLRPSSDSVYKMFETDINGVKVPPFWTPLEHISKSAAVSICFPSKVQATEVPMDSLPPPSYVIIFEAKQAHEILDTAKAFADDVLHVGYFDSINPEKAIKVAGTIHELEKMGEGKVNETKMVMALKKMSSDPMLVLAQMNPLHISADLASGTVEMEQFFPPTVEVVEEPDPWAPPPPEPKVYWTDEEDNVWVEENHVAYNGDIIRGRRLVKLADGTDVEDGEWREIPKDEPDQPVESEADVFDELGEDEDIGLLDDGYGPMRTMNMSHDVDEDTLIPISESSSRTNMKDQEENKEEKKDNKK